MNLGYLQCQEHNPDKHEKSQFLPIYIFNNTYLQYISMVNCDITYKYRTITSVKRISYTSSFFLFPGFVLGAAGRGTYSTSAPDTPTEKVDYVSNVFPIKAKQRF